MFVDFSYAVTPTPAATSFQVPTPITRRRFADTDVLSHYILLSRHARFFDMLVFHFVSGAIKPVTLSPSFTRYHFEFDVFTPAASLASIAHAQSASLSPAPSSWRPQDVRHHFARTALLFRGVSSPFSSAFCSVMLALPIVSASYRHCSSRHFICHVSC